VAHWWIHVRSNALENRLNSLFRYLLFLGLFGIALASRIDTRSRCLRLCQRSNLSQKTLRVLVISYLGVVLRCTSNSIVIILAWCRPFVPQNGRV